MTATRNLVEPETAERNRGIYGQLTFNSMPPENYHGPMFVFAAVRLGDHAHVEVQSGRWHHGPSGGTIHVSLAGRMILRWQEWVVLRDTLDSTTPWRIAEVEKPSDGQLNRYVTHAPPDIGSEVVV